MKKSKCQTLRRSADRENRFVLRLLFLELLWCKKKEDYKMRNRALVVIDLQNDITKNYREIIEKVNEAIDWAVQKKK